MFDLSAKFDEFEKKLNKMSPAEFDEMLIRCGIKRIKSSVESDYIRCLRKTFSEKDTEYSMETAFKTDAYDKYNDFNMDNLGQGAA